MLTTVSPAKEAEPQTAGGWTDTEGGGANRGDMDVSSISMVLSTHSQNLFSLSGFFSLDEKCLKFPIKPLF